jgi:starvation-inducible outer membrane lipoprotein
MLMWKQGIVAVLVALALSGCVGTPRTTDGPQSFLGISQDISSVFQTQDSYRSPLRPSFLGD